MPHDYSESRRNLLKTVAVSATGAALVGASSTGQAATQAKPATVPTDGSGNVRDGNLGPNMAGTRFRAVVSRGFGPNSTKLEELTLLPINERQIVIKTEATQCCYTMAARILGKELGPPSDGPVPLNDINAPTMQGHGGVGRVVAVGSAVRRVRVGDRVMVPVTPHCGVCYNCLHGRADRCMWGWGPAAKSPPIALAADGKEVFHGDDAPAFLAGMGEYMVMFEELTVPLFTDVPSEELAVLHCVGSAGLGTAMTLAPIRPGSSVAVFGLGPVGMSAVQGAHIAGATKIVGIDPVRARREAALNFGATDVLDPNETRHWELVAKIKQLCKNQTNRIYAGGTYQTPWRDGLMLDVGPDYTIEACGRDPVVLRGMAVESSPDPTGIITMQEIFQTVPVHGHLCTTGIGFDPADMVSFPADEWLDGSRQHHSSQFGGTHALRDIPAYVRLIEAGKFDAKGMITRYSLDHFKEAFDAVARRTTLAAVITMS